MTALWVALAIALDGAAALVGGLFPERWLERHRPEMLGFATGALLSAAVLDLIPEMLATTGAAGLPWLLGGVLVPALVEWLMSAHEHERHTVAPYALLGSDALHNFGDGMAIAASFVASNRLGVVTALAVIVHEVPEEIADYAVVRRAGMSKTRALVALAIVQLTAALGAVATLLTSAIAGVTGVILAIAAGTFLYIATVELLPGVLREQPKRDRRAALAALVLGVAVVAIVH